MNAKDFDASVCLVVPVSALRTKKSCGTGEFLDLIELAKLCKKAKISMIQVLPLNDTAFDSSPYNLVSAFALNPIYISLENLDGAENFDKEIKAVRNSFENLDRLAYGEVLSKKLKIAKSIYESVASKFANTLADKTSEEAIWLAGNTWIESYAIYKNIKVQNFQRSWLTWSEMRTPTKQELKTAWECPPLKSNYNFYVWIQYNLHKQLLEAAKACKKQGIMLKGDFPILLNEDSCDVWANHELFRSDITAGAPPDSENPNGQNWGFPCYFWQNHKEDSYKWWKERLRKGEQYYNAFRLDHILGFFRIWAIPKGESSSILGQYVPYTTISKRELNKIGFSDERIYWMSEPHISSSSIIEVNNNDYLNSHGELHKIAERIKNEELWVFKTNIKCEADISKCGLKPACEEVLRKKWKDRMLIKLRQKNVADELFTIAWNFKDTTAWASLSDFEKRAFLDLEERQNKKSEGIWEKQGREILSNICSSVSMQVFAEDLGAIPACVPKVLEELKIFSLKVVRWQRDWKSPDKNFIKLENYTPLSLTSPATHDNSTFETWWNDELKRTERLDLLKAIGVKQKELADKKLDEKSAEIILRAIAKSPSKVFAVQIQDLLTLISSEIKTKGDQRINTPGTVSDLNWTYRMPIKIETLEKNKHFIERVRSLRN